MSLSMKFMKPWSYEEVAGVSVRYIPINWLGELPDDVAAAAIFDGAAVPANGTITPDVQHYLDVYAQIRPDMTDDEIAVLMVPPSARVTIDPETGEILESGDESTSDESVEQPPPEKKKGKAKAAA